MLFICHMLHRNVPIMEVCCKDVNRVMIGDVTVIMFVSTRLNAEYASKTA